jgi:hypothetical protein
MPNRKRSSADLPSTIDACAEKAWGEVTSDPLPLYVLDLAHQAANRTVAKGGTVWAGYQSARITAWRAACNHVKREESAKAGRDMGSKARAFKAKCEAIDTRLSQGQEEVIVAVAMSDVNPNHARALLGRYAMGLVRAQLAAFLGVKEDCAYQWVCRGKKAIKPFLGPVGVAFVEYQAPADVMAGLKPVNKHGRATAVKRLGV